MSGITKESEREKKKIISTFNNWIRIKKKKLRKEYKIE